MTGRSKSEKIVRDIKRYTRHKYSSEEKILNWREEIKQKTLQMRRMKNLNNDENEMACNLRKCLLT
jgi:hypothetical protein